MSPTTMLNTCQRMKSLYFALEKLDHVAATFLLVALFLFLNAAIICW